MSGVALSPEFIAGERGRIFTLLRRRAADEGGSSILIVPPFAEEMNKCRRMLSLVGDGLAQRGIATIVVDPYGTGDSEGEFGDADWEIWQQDLLRAAGWYAQRGWPVMGMLCVRSGCLLGAALHRATTSQQPWRTNVFWQPVVSGERMLTQFLRLRVAANMMSSGPKETLTDLRGRLLVGESVEVAGYDVNGRLARQLDALQLAPLVDRSLGHLHWMELTRDVQAPLPTPSMQCIESLRACGTQVQIHRHTGEPYWSSTEIVVNAAVVEATITALAGTSNATIN